MRMPRVSSRTARQLMMQTATSCIVDCWISRASAAMTLRPASAAGDSVVESEEGGDAMPQLEAARLRR